MVNYVYDAWGNHKVLDASGEEITYEEDIGNINPFRYRSYYYDTEFKLYYLQTRYYDPEVGRFISQDAIDYADPETINGLNLYAYCGNNPVMGYDPEGTLDNSGIINFLSALFEIGIGGSLAFIGRAIKTGAKPNNIGIGIFNKDKIRQLGNLTKASNILSKVTTAVAVASVIVSVIDSIKTDINHNYSVGRIISNAYTNTIIYGGLTFGLGALGGHIGSLLGTIVPGLGNVVGAAVGFAFGTLIGFLLDLKVNNKSIINHIRDGIYSFWKWLFG